MSTKLAKQTRRKFKAAFKAKEALVALRASFRWPALAHGTHDSLANPVCDISGPIVIRPLLRREKNRFLYGGRFKGKQIFGMHWLNQNNQICVIAQSGGAPVAEKERLGRTSS